MLGGAFNCGKGQPGQVAPVSHGCPSALFRGINVLNARAERVPVSEPGAEPASRALAAQDVVERALWRPAGPTPAW